MTDDIYLFRYNKPVSASSLERQLTDNPEVNVTSTKSLRLQQQLDQLDNITEVCLFTNLSTRYFEND